jgi:hypothetical protein
VYEAEPVAVPNDEHVCIGDRSELPLRGSVVTVRHLEDPAASFSASKAATVQQHSDYDQNA